MNKWIKVWTSFSKITTIIVLDFREMVTKPNSKHTCNSKVSRQNIHILEPNARNIESVG